MNRFLFILISARKTQSIIQFYFKSKVNNTLDFQVKGQEDRRTDIIYVLARRHQDKRWKTVNVPVKLQYKYYQPQIQHVRVELGFKREFYFFQRKF